MKLISGWIIPVTGFKTQNQSIAPRELVPVCLWLMTPPALGELNFGTVFTHKPRKNSQPGRIRPSKKDFQDSLLVSSWQHTAGHGRRREGAAQRYHGTFVTPGAGGMSLPQAAASWAKSCCITWQASLRFPIASSAGSALATDPTWAWEQWLWPGKAPGSRRYGARSWHPTSKADPLKCMGLLQNARALL